MSQAWTLDPDSLQLILSYFENDKGFLFRMSTLNKKLYLLVLPLLYTSNSFISVTRASRFCQSLHNHRHSPTRFVRELRIHVIQGSKKLFWTKEAVEFVPLFHRTLPLLPNLKYLSVTGTEFEMQQPLSQLPFSLHSLNLLLPINVPFLEFLQTQNSLRSLVLRSSRVPLGRSDCLNPESITGENLLPNLSSLVSCSQIFATLAPGRPITHATVNRCQTHRWRTLMSILIAGIDQLTGPLKTLRVDLGSVYDMRCVDFVTSLVNTRVALTLEALTLVSTSLDNDYWMPLGGKHSGSLASPPQLFSGLRALRSLIIEKPSLGPEDVVFDEELDEPILPVETEYDSIWSHTEAKELWRTNCSKLTSIRIYSKRLDLGA